MSLQETLFGMLTIAGGIVIGTILTWTSVASFAKVTPQSA